MDTNIWNSDSYLFDEMLINIWLTLYSDYSWESNSYPGILTRVYLSHSSNYLEVLKNVQYCMKTELMLSMILFVITVWIF